MQALVAYHCVIPNGEMDRIHYAGDSLVTGTDIARAVVGYAQVLADSNSSATIDVPILMEDGSRGTAEFLVGPASQIVAETIAFEGEELIDVDAVAALEAAAANLGGVHAVPVASPPFSSSAVSDFDLPPEQRAAD